MTMTESVHSLYNVKVKKTFRDHYGFGRSVLYEAMCDGGML